MKEGAIGLGTARKDCSLASCFFLPRTQAAAQVLGVGSDLSASGASLWSSCSLLSSTEVLTPELGVGVVRSGKSLTFLLELQERVASLSDFLLTDKSVKGYYLSFYRFICQEEI